MKLSLWILGVIVGIAALAAPYSPSSESAYWVFNQMMGFILGHVFILLYSYVHSFLAFFFCLGFQIKFIIYIAFGNLFIEPTDLFNGPVQHWDAALIASAATGIFTARILCLFYLWRKSNRGDASLLTPWVCFNYKKSLFLIRAGLINLGEGIKTYIICCLKQTDRYFHCENQ